MSKNGKNTLFDGRALGVSANRMKDIDPEYARLCEDHFWDLEDETDAPKKVERQPKSSKLCEEQKLDDVHFTARDLDTNDLIVINGELT